MEKKREDERENERENEEVKMKEKRIFLWKMFQNPQTRQMNKPKMFRNKIFFGRIIPPFFFETSESDRVFNYLHDSNSIFRTAGINSEIFFGRTVYLACARWVRSTSNCRLVHYACACSASSVCRSSTCRWRHRSSSRSVLCCTCSCRWVHGACHQNRSVEDLAGLGHTRTRPLAIVRILSRCWVQVCGSPESLSCKLGPPRARVACNGARAAAIDRNLNCRFVRVCSSPAGASRGSTSSCCWKLGEIQSHSRGVGTRGDWALQPVVERLKHIAVHLWAATWGARVGSAAASVDHAAAVSGISRPTLAARNCPTHNPSVTPLTCWSKGATLSRVHFAPLQSHTLVLKTSMKDGWVGRHVVSVWNSQWTDHNRGAGGRAVGTHLSLCCHFDSRQQCPDILTSRPPSCSFQVVAWFITAALSPLPSHTCAKNKYEGRVGGSSCGPVTVCIHKHFQSHHEVFRHGSCREADGAVRWTQVLALLEDAEDWNAEDGIDALSRLPTNPEWMEHCEEQNRTIMQGHSHGVTINATWFLFERDNVGLERTQIPRGQLLPTTNQS